MPLQTPFKKNGIFLGKKCPPSSARNFLLAGEPCSRFWNGAEVVKEGVDRSRLRTNHPLSFLVKNRNIRRRDLEGKMTLNEY